MSLPSSLDQPSFLMSFPFTVGNGIPNNVWMHEDSPPYDRHKAFAQWTALYRRLAAEGVVWLLPTEGDFQDRPFVADVAAVMHHAPGKVAVSNLACNGRYGEEESATRFFIGMGYEVARCPFRWNGEADLKHLRGNLYIGGYGQRTTMEAFLWLSNTFGAQVTPIKLDNPKAYHLDATLFPLTEDAVLMATSLFDQVDVKKVEAVAEVIEVPAKWAYSGWTNIVRLGKRVLHNPTSPESALALQQVLGHQGFEVETVDLSEFDKSGADLSCLVCHLNERNRALFTSALKTHIPPNID